MVFISQNFYWIYNGQIWPTTVLRESRHGRKIDRFRAVQPHGRDNSLDTLLGEINEGLHTVVHLGGGDGHRDDVLVAVDPEVALTVGDLEVPASVVGFDDLTEVGAVVSNDV